jgi:hypothetical protein
MADILLSPLEKKMTDVYIALRSQVADELDIVAIWCFVFSGSPKSHLKTGGHMLTLKIVQIHLMSRASKIIEDKQDILAKVVLPVQNADMTCM